MTDYQWPSERGSWARPPGSPPHPPPAADGGASPHTYYGYHQYYVYPQYVPQAPRSAPGLRSAVAIFVALAVLSFTSILGMAAIVSGTRSDTSRSLQLTVSTQELLESVVRVTGEACNFEKQGTGFFVGPGLVVTNAHVVAGVDFPILSLESSRVPRTFNSSVVHFDPDNDIAVLRTSATGSTLFLADSDPRKGETLFAPGFPQGGEFQVKQAVFRGSMEARTESIYGKMLPPKRYLVVDSSLEPGNSGSPVLDAAGFVVGVASAVSKVERSTGVLIPHERIEAAVVAAERSPGPVSAGSCYTKED